MDQRTNAGRQPVRRAEPLPAQGRAHPVGAGLLAAEGGDAQVPRRRPRQPELGRHDAARGVLHARPVRAAGVEARLGRAAISAACRTPTGSPTRLARVPEAAPSGPGAKLLARALDYGVDDAGLRRRRVRPRAGRRHHRRQLPDARPHAACTPRPIVRKYLEKAMYDGRPPAGKFDLFAVEGGTAAMCYVFGSLVANRVLAARRHDRARHADLHALPRDAPARASSRSRRSRSSRARCADGRHDVAVPRRGDRQARGPAGQGVLRRQPQQPGVGRDAPRDASTASSSWCGPSGPI